MTNGIRCSCLILLCSVDWTIVCALIELQTSSICVVQILVFSLCVVKS
jgi:hypothetical protein